MTNEDKNISNELHINSPTAANLGSNQNVLKSKHITTSEEIKKSFKSGQKKSVRKMISTQDKSW
jgi:hypothetical protein